MKYFSVVFCLLLFVHCASNSESLKQEEPINIKDSQRIIVAAERTSIYLPLLDGKKVALVVNPSSLVKGVHLVDTLSSLGVNLKRILAPEHGFRGMADAGEHVKDGVDSKTGLPIISLYGKHKKPYPEDIQDIDIVIFDLQDVGTRFYTYISTLQYVMEACAEQGKTVLVLDRPNPNGHYVDGPVLEKKHKSFVGMQSIPIVHGMTVAEYALMINEESWLKDSLKVDLKTISCQNYDHTMFYALPVRPSPNLPNDKAINLYPSLCLFEGTKISVGRGTDFPFQVFGHPEIKGEFSFTPGPNEGSKKPKLNGLTCQGLDLRSKTERMEGINLDFLISAYNNFPRKDEFFISFFEKLAGTSQLRKMIEEGKSSEEIYASWQEDLEVFKSIRKRYLLYKDFK